MRQLLPTALLCLIATNDQTDSKKITDRWQCHQIMDATAQQAENFHIARRQLLAIMGGSWPLISTSLPPTLSRQAQNLCAQAVSLAQAIDEVDTEGFCFDPNNGHRLAMHRRFMEEDSAAIRELLSRCIALPQQPTMFAHSCCTN